MTISRSSNDLLKEKAISIVNAYHSSVVKYIFQKLPVQRE
jgi:hypothetical protein